MSNKSLTWFKLWCLQSARSTQWCIDAVSNELKRSATAKTGYPRTGAEPHVRCTLFLIGDRTSVPRVTVAPAGTIYKLYLFSSFPGLFHPLFLFLVPLRSHHLPASFLDFVAIYLSLHLLFFAVVPYLHTLSLCVGRFWQDLIGLSQLKAPSRFVAFDFIAFVLITVCCNGYPNGVNASEISPWHLCF